MDFMAGLPESQSYKRSLVMVNRLYKMCHRIPCDTTVDVEQTVKPDLQHFWKLHSLATHNPSDSGTPFTPNVWKSLFQQPKIEATMSTAYHPDTGGLTE